MGITGSGLARFEGRLTESLASCFPGYLGLPGGASVDAFSNGGRVFREFDEQGLQVTRRVYTVRIRKSDLPEANLPAIGALVTWTPEGETARDCRVTERPDHPRELTWSLELTEQ